MAKHARLRSLTEACCNIFRICGSVAETLRKDASKDSKNDGLVIFLYLCFVYIRMHVAECLKSLLSSFVLVVFCSFRFCCCFFKVFMRTG